jgi:hypothetical protein
VPQAEVVDILLLKLAVAAGDIGKCQQARNGALCFPLGGIP